MRTSIANVYVKVYDFTFEYAAGPHVNFLLSTSAHVLCLGTLLVRNNRLL